MMKQPAADLTQIYTRIVERYATFFPRPEARLRFFNSTVAKQVARQKKIENTLKKFSFVKKTPLYRWVMESMLHRSIIEELNDLLPTSKAERKAILKSTKIPVGAKFVFWLFRFRYAFYALGLASIGLLIFGLYTAALWSGNRLNEYLAKKYGRGGNEPAGVIATKIAQYLPGYNPDKVWFVKKEGNYELYSNGARILTDFETDNHPRNYYLYATDDPLKNLGLPIQHRIVGIVFHTTEGEMVDFRSDNNDDLLRHSHGMLSYIKNEKSYNYVIDRIGQIYRVVRDNQAANHAGNSLWNDDTYTYVGLNESFLGVAFETRAEAAAGEQLTEAQQIAGRQLTAILRSTHNIEDANCTTHGLVSISQSNMLIGFHHDWAHNFPFETMGLSDKYPVPPTSVAEYGCSWEDEIVAKMGGHLWQGVTLAEAKFKSRAEKAQLKPEELRKRMKERYSEQMDMLRKLRDANASELDQAINKTDSPDEAR